MLFLGMCVYSQEATEIYLFDLIKTENSYTIKNPINISNSEGYDNQPCFREDGTSILFSSFRNDQADIAQYNIEDNFRTWITDTKEVSEFSPAPFPGKKKFFTCVRFGKDGSQELYKYPFKNKTPVAIVPNIKVGYYSWFDKNNLVSFVLGDIETLQVSNFKYKIKYPIQSNIGRSINKVPASASNGKALMSFISKSHEVPEIYAIDPITSEFTFLADALEDSEDFTWTLDGAIFMGNDSAIYYFIPKKSKEWLPITIESDLPIEDITRLAVSPDGKKIVVVVAE
jgi:Tol biopolymer transport system component